MDTITLPPSISLPDWGELKLNTHYSRPNTDGNEIVFQLPFPTNLSKRLVMAKLAEALSLATEKTIDPTSIKLTFKSPDHSKPHPTLGRVRNIIAICSTKGGVGKSAVALNLARYLAKQGADVGLADLDIHGPSTLASLQDKKYPSLTQKNVKGKNIVEPPLIDGVKVLSVAMSLPHGSPAPWRGPMASKVAAQILAQTSWGQLDYLILDMPPGTGDITLTINQQFPPTASLTVTTPHAFATDDTLRGLALLKQLSVPCLGLIANMVWFTCPNCDEKHHIFGRQDPASIAKAWDLPLLASLPIDPDQSGLWEQTPASDSQQEQQAVQALRQQVWLDLSAKFCLGLQRQPRVKPAPEPSKEPAAKTSQATRINIKHVQ